KRGTRKLDLLFGEKPSVATGEIFGPPSTSVFVAGPMSYSPILIFHICAGTVGLLSGTAAMIYRKGSRGHVLAGRVFTVSMLCMAVGAVYLAIMRHQPSNIDGGILTFYLIGTAWL